MLRTKTKLLSRLERVTRTIVYHIGFDAQSKTWRVLSHNGKIFGNFAHKENAKEYARVAATIEYRKRNNIKDDLIVDGTRYNGKILEEVMSSDVDLDIPDDILTEEDL